jgi:DNA-binding transcriptional regulator LsrR (DeoR family)
VSTARSRATLAAAARLYYIDGLSQEAAAAELGMTRSNFSRVLTAAREAGIVEFRINDDDDRELELERELADAFGLRRTRVARASATDVALSPAARLAAGLLADSLDGASIVAVSWGTTVRAVVEALTAPERSDLRVVQLVGGLTSFDAQASAHDLVRELGRRLNAGYLYLNAPGVFDSAHALHSLCAEQSVRSTLELAQQADVALVGIGNPEAGSSHALLRQLARTDDHLARFWNAGPAGDVCGRYYDADGNPLQIAGISDRVLAIDIPALRRIPISIGAAVGKAKCKAVLGALRGRLVNALVCDEPLAREVLACAEANR